MKGDVRESRAARILVVAGALLASPACRENPEEHPVPVVSEEQLALLEPAAREAIADAREALLRRAEDSESHGRLAMLLHAHGLLAEAASAYETAQALAPDDARWPRLDAHRAAEAGDEEEALVKARQAVLRDARSVAARTTLGVLELRRGRVDESRDHFETALEIEPRNVAALRGMATVEFRGGNLGDALDFVERALAVDPDDPRMHYTAALAWERLGDPARAQDHLAASRQAPSRRPAIEPPPEIAALRGRGARAALAAGTDLLEQGRHEAAVFALTEATRMDPGSADAQNALGAALEESGDLVAARLRYERAVALDPDLAVTRMNLGVLLGRLGELDAAVEHLESAVRLDPGRADAWTALGSALEASRRPGEAMAAYREAVSRDAGLARARLRLGVLLGEGGQIEDAVFHLREAVQRTPESGEAHHYLAVGLLRLGDVGEALEHEKRAIVLAEAAGEEDLLGTARYSLGLLLRESGLLAEALASLEGARERFPGNLDLLAELAHTHHLVGDHAAAIEVQRQVAAARPDDADSHYRLGVFLAASGDSAAARRAFRESLRAEPGFVPAAEALRRLDREF